MERSCASAMDDRTSVGGREEGNKIGWFTARRVPDGRALQRKSDAGRPHSRIENATIVRRSRNRISGASGRTFPREKNLLSRAASFNRDARELRRLLRVHCDEFILIKSAESRCERVKRQRFRLAERIVSVSGGGPKARYAEICMLMVAPNVAVGLCSPSYHGYSKILLLLVIAITRL